MSDLSNQIINQVIIGSVLGDASIIQNGTNAYFEETHSLKQQDYLAWKNQYLHTFNGRIKDKIVINKRLNRIYPHVRLSTSTLPRMTEFRKVFYPDGKKIISNDILFSIDELGLTVWYLDDGHVSLPDDIITISTDAFTYDEHLIIKKWFKKRFNVNAEIKKRNATYYVTFNVSDSRKLLAIFKEVFNIYGIPYSMRYKLGTLWDGNTENIKIARENLRGRKRKYNEKLKQINRLQKEAKYSPIIEQVRELYLNNQLDAYQIAHKMNYSPAGIYKLMKKFNVPRRTKSEANILRYRYLKQVK